MLLLGGVITRRAERIEFQIPEEIPRRSRDFRTPVLHFSCAASRSAPLLLVKSHFSFALASVHRQEELISASLASKVLQKMLLS